MVQGVLDTLGDDWTLKRMVYDNENKYEFPSIGNHLKGRDRCERGALGGTGGCIGVWGSRPHWVFAVVSESEPSVKGRWMSDRCLITR